MSKFKDWVYDETVEDEPEYKNGIMVGKRV